MWSVGNKRTGGFSLLELLVVMLIVSLSAVAIAAALPRIASGPAVELAAARLAAGLKKARMRAISLERVVTVTIDPATRRYRLGAGGARRLPDTVRIVPLRSTVIRFYPDGGADAAAIQVAGEQRSLRIDVSPMTGQVTVR